MRKSPVHTVAGELGCVRSFRPSVLAFCRGGSSFPNSAASLRFRLSTVEALRPLVVACVGDRVGRIGDPAELVPLVCRDPVLGDVGTGLFASSEASLACPFGFMSLTSLERLRPFCGEWERVFSLIESSLVGSSSSRSFLITSFSFESSSRDSTTVSASDSFSSWSPFCVAGRFSLAEGEATLGAGWTASPELLGGLRGASRDAFRSPLLVITHIWDRTREFLPHDGSRARDDRRGRQAV
jgi:hypothetical protein